MWKLALISIALAGLVTEPALARMMTSSFASRSVSVGPRANVGTLKSFNIRGGALTRGQTQSSSSQGTAFKRYKLENAWPSKAGATSSGRTGGSGHGLLLPAVKSAGAGAGAALLLPAVQAAREPARRPGK